LKACKRLIGGILNRRRILGEKFSAPMTRMMQNVEKSGRVRTMMLHYLRPGCTLKPTCRYFEGMTLGHHARSVCLRLVLFVLVHVALSR
jgi:hypothetical protein